MAWLFIGILLMSAIVIIICLYQAKTKYLESRVVKKYIKDKYGQSIEDLLEESRKR